MSRDFVEDLLSGKAGNAGMAGHADTARQHLSTEFAAQDSIYDRYIKKDEEQKPPESEVFPYDPAFSIVNGIVMATDLATKYRYTETIGLRSRGACFAAVFATQDLLGAYRSYSKGDQDGANVYGVKAALDLGIYAIARGSKIPYGLLLSGYALRMLADFMPVSGEKP